MSQRSDRREYAKALRYETDEVDHAVLRTIAVEGPIKRSDIELEAIISSQQSKRALDNLLEDGKIKRYRSEEDQRIYLYDLDPL